jgi:hypothetical protein
MTKSKIFTIFAMALLITAGAFAQLPQHQTTYGTVVSIDADRLIIESADDQETFQIVAGTTLPNLDEIQVGDAIAVDWNVGETATALPIVRAIRIDDRGDTDVAMVTEVETDLEADLDTDVDVDEDVDVVQVEPERRVVTERTVTVTEPDTTVTDVQVQDTTTTTATLPQTASKLPLAGLIGLLSLAGAAMLTWLRK